MDKQKAQEQIVVAESIIDLIGDVGKVVSSLQQPLQPKVLQRGLVSEGPGALVIASNDSIEWPYPPALCNLDDSFSGASEVVATVTRLAQPLPQLVEEARPFAKGGFFSRLFRGSTMANGQTAAESLQGHVDAIRQAPGWDQMITYRAQIAQVMEDFQALPEAPEGAGVWLSSPILNPASQARVRAGFLSAAGSDLSATDGALSWQQVSDGEVTAARSFLKDYLADPNSVPQLKTQAATIKEKLARANALALMDELAVESLKSVTESRISIKPLEDAGITTVGQVLRHSATQLQSLNGIGENTARRIRGAAQSLFNEAAATPVKGLGVKDTASSRQLICVLEIFDQVLQGRGQDFDVQIAALQDTFGGSISAVWYPAPHGYTLVGSPETVAATYMMLRWAGNPYQPLSITKPSAEGAWQRYLKRPAHYQVLLDRLLDNDTAGEDSFLSEEIQERVRELRLREDFCTPMSLRGYQSYGARFAVTQKKTVLGDEMGLGKTVQAIVFANHVAALYADRKEPCQILVACPASVTINWTREIEKFSTLPVLLAHGSKKHQTIAPWERKGGFLVATYEGVKALNLDAVDVVIADEAHMVKNPDAQRSKALRKYIELAEYTLLLSGTPLENRLEEFNSVISYLQPELINSQLAGLDPLSYRKRVAPAYLRRNQAEVLHQLPDRIDEVDYIEFTPADQKAYREAVASGNFAAMLQAAYRATETEPAKITRIKEIVADAKDAGRKVIIFSAYLDTLKTIANALGDAVVGTVTGAVPPPARQSMVDELKEAPPGSVLMLQIKAGGEGLNIQSASVVIIAEPQVKPTLEDQAIARAFRMGQTSTVYVHRLVGDDTVDERMMDLLSKKRVVFDDYARPSVSGEVADAQDISDQKIAKTIIAAEKARLGLEEE